jgi:hypothetical protein
MRPAPAAPLALPVKLGRRLPGGIRSIELPAQSAILGAARSTWAYPARQRRERVDRYHDIAKRHQFRRVVQV